MNKNDLTESVAATLGKEAKDAREAINAITVAITAAVAAGDKVTIAGFGTFMPVPRKERDARNPATGQQIHVPAKTAIVFRAGSGFREKVNGTADGTYNSDTIDDTF